MSAFAFSLTIAGYTVSFHGKSSTMGQKLINHYSPYMRKRVKADLCIECVFTRKPASRRVQAGFVPGSTKHAGRHDFTVDWKGKIGNARIYPAIASFDSCLRTLFASDLPLRGFLLMHAAAIADSRGALVFPGPSGSGKTTIARFATGKRKVLTDELCAVGCHRTGEYMVSATPFWGELGCGKPHKYEIPLRSIVFPRKAKQDSLETLSPQDALSRLLRCVCTFARSPGHMESILGVAVRLAQEARFSEMAFRKSPDFWSVL